MRWGPTSVPIYNLLLLLTIIFPDNYSQHLEIARWLSTVAGVSVDGCDLSGTSALSHAISTKPSLDPDFAQVLYDAGGDVNHRNRYGGTAAHEIITIFAKDEVRVRRATNALQWFLEHGGNVDIKDGDGMSVRYMAYRTSGMFSSVGGGRIIQLIENEDARRTERGDGCCTFCGREDAERLLVCGKCRKARYCPAPGGSCQRLDWPRHKSMCKLKA